MRDLRRKACVITLLVCCDLVLLSGLADFGVHLADNQGSPSFLDFEWKISHYEPLIPWQNAACTLTAGARCQRCARDRRRTRVHKIVKHAFRLRTKMVGELVNGQP
jgi:hypothetical protein